MFKWIILCFTLASFGNQANAADKCKFDRPQGVPVIEQDCARMCQADLGCTHYHYEFMPMKGFVRCYLYKGPQQAMVKSTELRCGLRDIWINMENSSIGQNCLFTGKIVKLKNLTSSKQCLDNCKEDLSAHISISLQICTWTAPMLLNADLCQATMGVKMEHFLLTMDIRLSVVSYYQRLIMKSTTLKQYLRIKRLTKHWRLFNLLGYQ